MDSTQNSSHWLSQVQYGDLRKAMLMELEQILSRLFGYYLLQISHPDYSLWVASSMISKRCLVYSTPGYKSALSYVQADLSQLPFLSDSIDVIALTNLLDCCEEPKALLREVHRVLMPQGHIVIAGINPFSLIGLIEQYKRYRHYVHAPKILTMHRVIDWLELLGFEVSVQKAVTTAQKQGWLGLKWRMLVQKLPWLGGAYVIHAIKKTSVITPIKPKWRLRTTRVWEEETAATFEEVN